MLTLNAISFIAEQKIQQAIQEGAFDNLPGSGKPLVLEDLSNLPEEMRMAYTILKNSGFIADKNRSKPVYPDRGLLESNPEEGQTNNRLRRFEVMMNRVRRAQGKGADAILSITPDSPYLDKLLKRV